jgi:2-keto-4-pentenoate hydratase/2-oxohepta-3-ene-1,7-dioic acid hydratase in catechol pathway
MRFYCFESDGTAHFGVGTPDGKRLLDLAAAAPELPKNPVEFIAGFAWIQPVVRQIIQSNQSSNWTYDLESLRLLAPIPRPGKILCSGINYRSHLQENPDASLPEEPFFFAKLPSTVIGPSQPIICPRRSQQVDYEIELAVVIGTKMKETAESDALEHVFGYTILHDLSARDVQFRHNQITLGKNFDTFCPIGPCVVTRDEIPRPDRIRLKTFLNGRTMQDASTSDWLFSLPRLLSFLSQRITLEPGDIVSTGTPAGVGVFRKPPIFLKPGDIVRLEADQIGVLQNNVTTDYERTRSGY